VIHYYYSTDFKLTAEDVFSRWLIQVAQSEGFEVSEITYAFVSDQELYDMNIQFLNHDTLTDVIGFDNTVGKNLQGDIAISIDRVRENASAYEVPFEQELLRVMVHGLLHFCGFSDKSKDEKQLMTLKEEEKIRLFHVKHKSKSNV
jgi:rRNA maturation RNase YbeY